MILIPRIPLQVVVRNDVTLEAADDAEHLRLCGELLKTHLGRVPARASRITVPNLFAPGSPDVTIRLLPNQSARENMERYFRRYKKRAATRQQVERRAVSAGEQVLAGQQGPVESPRPEQRTVFHGRQP